MKKLIVWGGSILGVLAVIGFLAFLYLIPPFTLAPPEDFINQTVAGTPSLKGITDPVTRALAERGKYLVTVHDCSGCHTPFGDEGPNMNEFLAGGNRTVFREYGTTVTRNLTPDTATGLGRRTEEQVLRVLRTGLLPEGRVAHYRDMPWAFYSRWSPEDRYAVMVYLRHLKPVYHLIPDPHLSTASDDPEALETIYGADVAGHNP